MPNGRFCIQNIDFWAPLRHSFFNIFRKTESREFIAQGIVWECFSIPKSIIFRCISHWFFMFFPETFPETIFGGSKRRSMLESAVLGNFWISGVPKMVLFACFGPKKILKTIGQNYRAPPGAPGPPLQRRPPAPNGPKQFVHWFCLDVGWILERFWIDFPWFGKIS